MNDSTETKRANEEVHVPSAKEAIPILEVIQFKYREDSYEYRCLDTAIRYLWENY